MYVICLIISLFILDTKAGIGDLFRCCNPFREPEFCYYDEVCYRRKGEENNPDCPGVCKPWHIEVVYPDESSSQQSRSSSEEGEEGHNPKPCRSDLDCQLNELCRELGVFDRSQVGSSRIWLGGCYPKPSWPWPRRPPGTK